MELNEMNDEERAEYERILTSHDYRCMCDNAEGRAQCSNPHTNMPLGHTRCPHGAFVLVTEPDGSLAVLCRDCEANRLKTARRVKREAKAARAKAYAEAQISILDLLAEAES